MERQLVAPTIDQWRSVQRSQRDQAAAYSPLEITRGFRPRNRQLLRITSSTPDPVTGYYPADWVVSDVSDQTHAEQTGVWAWALDGVAEDGGLFEGEHVGDYEDLPVFRGSQLSTNFPNFLRMVTNVCDISGTSSFTLPASVDAVVDSEAGINTASGTYPAKRGPTKIKAVVTWIDPDYESSSGDSFSFKLYVNSTELTGAPIYTIVTIGGTATIEKQMEWPVNFDKDGDVELVLLCYRVSGSRSLVAQAGTTRIEIAGLPSGIRTEYRQITLPPGVVVGPEVCIDRPTDCCVDDQSSDTSSRDTSSRTPYPTVGSWPDSPTCIDTMGWRGLAVHGVFGTGDVTIPKRFKVRLPSFVPWSHTAYGVSYPACDPRIADYLSGRDVIIETGGSSSGDSAGPDLGQAWALGSTGFYTYYNPEGIEGCTAGGCGYGLDAITDQYESYTDPNGYTWAFQTGYTYALSATWGYGLLNPSSIVLPRRPVFVIKTIAGLTIRAAASGFLTDFFFDEPITLPLVTDIGYVTANPAQRRNPASPYYQVEGAGIKATGDVVLEPY